MENKNLKRFKMSLEKLPQGIIILDEKKRIVFFNQKAQEMLNLKEDFLFREIDEIKEIEELKPISDIFEKEIFKIFGKEIKIKEDLILRLSAIDLKENQEEEGFLIFFSDITREVSLERLKKEFIALAAHQLRTPISAVQWGVSKILEEKMGPLNQTQKSYLEEILQTIQRLVKIIDDLLHTTKIEEGRILEKTKKFSLEAIIDYVVSLLGSEITKKKINLEIKKPTPSLPQIQMDVEKIKLVIQNLLDNAIKYTKEHGKIIISLEEKGGKEILFSIKDNGIGISEKDRGRIFTKFFRAENAQKVEPSGSGLGLYVAKNIIEAHGGKIWFESKEGKGATFYFTLPMIV
jgi:NtrC-family two-component system sensor histidine kinase KinB